MKTSTILAVTVAGLAFVGCKAAFSALVPHVERWANGLTKREGMTASDQQTGEWIYYYESGQRRAAGHYENDHRVGAWTSWFENGGVEWTGTFDPSGKRVGEWTFFHADSTMRARGRYVADAEDGPWEFFHPDGSPDRRGQYDKGLMSGPWTHFHVGGKPKAEGTCHRGQRIGLWTMRDESGKEGVQDFGSRAGVEIALEAWPNGKPKRTGVLQNGAPTGRWTSYHENGSPRFCCTLNGAVASGVFEARNEQGQVTAAGVLADGKVVDGSPEAAATVAVACTELAATVAATARAPITPPVPLPPPPPAVVAEVATQEERVPAPAQVAPTVQQEKELAAIVENYRDGESPGRPSLKKYPTDSKKPASGSGSGPRALTELEGKPLPIDELRGVDGKTVRLADYVGKKQVLLVVLRGFLGEVCMYCVAQTEALAQCRAELEALGIEVLVLYPGPRENEKAFEKTYEMTFGKGAPPYRVFYDPDLELVRKLGVSGDLAYPTTIIVDRQGVVRYAYVGKDRADRPAARALIKKIKELKQ